MITTKVNSINRHQWISEAAYYKAEIRGFESGKALDDWLEAETDYSVMLVALYISILEEDGPITTSGLQELATFIGIQNPECITSEPDLVRAIQHATNQRPCFRSPEIPDVCDSVDCHWKKECRKLISVWY